MTVIYNIHLIYSQMMLESLFNCSRVSEDLMTLMLLPGFPSYQVKVSTW